MARGPDSKRKEPFDIHTALRLIRAAVKPFPKAAMFELAEAGYATPFQQLIACIISIRTRDETSLPAARKLFEVAPTARQIAALAETQIDHLISAATFHRPKSKTIRTIARRVNDEFKGDLPCDVNTMLSFSGVGPKCAHLAAGVACGQKFISVDIHVHRVTNRWGYVHARTPEATLAELVEVLPKKYWIEINRLLVPFGKHICTGLLPKCSACPLLSMCQQIGVSKHR